MDFKKNGAFTIVFLLSICAFAQQKQGSNWLFGNGARIGFNSGTAVSDTGSAMKAATGCGTISDAKGNLLFYTNGTVVWNRKHTIMPNGAGLLSADSNKAVLIQKKPGNNHLYYIFVANNPVPGDPTTGRLYYSIVDMDQQNGLGDVLPMMKNMLLLPRVARMIASAQHQNNKDFWIVAHGFPPLPHIFLNWLPGEFDSTFYCFKLSEQGIDLAPINSTISDWSYMAKSTVRNGWMRTSPSSELISYQLEDNDSYFSIVKLDRSTGSISKQFLLRSDMFSGKGCFSADSRFYFLADGGARMHVFDLTLGNEDAIQSQYQFAFVEYYGVLFPSVTDVQLGLDGKLYVNPYPGATFLSRINFPCKRYGPACGFEKYAVDLKGRKCGLEFPVHNQTLFVNAGKLQAMAAKDTICAGDSVELTAFGAGASRFRWTRNNETSSFSDSGMVKVAPTQTTTYKVRGSDLCGTNDTSVTVVVVPRPTATIITDTSVCAVGKTRIRCQTGAGWKYEWRTDLGTVSNGYLVADSIAMPVRDTTWSGYVTLHVTTPGCTVSDSVRVSVYSLPKQKPLVQPFPDTAICLGEAVKLSTSPTPGLSVQWLPGGAGPHLFVSQSGTYTARYRSDKGCLSDSGTAVTVLVNPLPVVHAFANQKKDSTVCFPASLQLGIAPQPHVRYQWTGGKDSISNPLASNPQFVFALTDTLENPVRLQLLAEDTLTGCRNSDSLHIRLVPYLRPDAGLDQAFCNGEKATIGLRGFSGFQYQWAPADGLDSPDKAVSECHLPNPSFENVRSQTFARTVRFMGCQQTDSVRVLVYPSVPKPLLEGPAFVCPGVHNVPYAFSTVPGLNNLSILTYRLRIQGGDSVQPFTINWNSENPNAGIGLVLGNVYGCRQDSVYFPVNVTRNLHPFPRLSAGLNDSVCLHNATHLAYPIAPFNPRSRYQWAISPQTYSIGDSVPSVLTIGFEKEGVYHFTLSESDTTPIAQCYGKTEFPVRIWPHPVAKLIQGADSMCVDGAVALKMEDDTSTSTFEWYSDVGEFIPTQGKGPKKSFTAQGFPVPDFATVHIKAIETSNKGCAGPVATKELIVESSPEPVFVPADGKLTWNELDGRHYAVKGRAGSSYFWDARNGTILAGQGTSEAVVNWASGAGDYELLVEEKTSVGCLGTARYGIPYDSSLFIPNLVTANRDGKNDAFRIENLSLYAAARLVVFDRWGRQVYSSDRYANNWPGDDVAAGIYFFDLLVPGMNRSQKGYVVVMR